MAIDMTLHFTLPQLLRYALPSIAMTLFTSIYVIVDGVFVSNCAGSIALAAINWAWPPLMIMGAVGFMLGTGGAALIAKTRGEGDDEHANRIFSMIIIFAAILGILLALVGLLTMRPLFALMGAEGDMLDLALRYGYLSLISIPAYVLGNAFQMIFPAAGKPRVGLYIMLVAGVTNIVLDALFIAGFGWGVTGAALATVIGEILSGIIPIVYFARPNSSHLRLFWTRFEWKALVKTCTNGLSELVSEVSVSFVTILFNFQLLRFVGEDGVAVFGVIGYVELLFLAIFMGFSIGTDPLMSFQYGARNHEEMRSLFRKSLLFVSITGVAMLLLSQLSAPLLAAMFMGYDADLSALFIHSFRIYSLYTLAVGIGIYASSLFTALNNGLVSALISFLRTLVLEAGAVLLIPMFFGVEGIWYSTPIADLGAAIISIALMVALGPTYGYMHTRKTKGNHV